MKRKKVFTTEHSTTLICCKPTANASSKNLQKKKKGHDSAYLLVSKCIHHELTATFFPGEQEKNAAAFKTAPVKTLMLQWYTESSVCGYHEVDRAT